MANVFDITVANDKVTLDAKGRAEITFTVSNATDHAVQGRVKVVGEGPAQFAVVGEMERPYPKGGVQQCAVTLTVPGGTPAGSYKFHLLAMNVANPGEDFTDGPTVGYEVVKTESAPVTGPKIPWWIFVVAGVVLLLLIGVVTYVLWPDPKVPKVVDLKVDDAVAQLKKKSLTAEIEEVESDKTPKTVISQVPEAGGKLPPDGKVKLSVAIADVVVLEAVPNVVGMTRAAAESLLKDKGFRVDTVTPDIQGTVIDQNPREGVRVLPASTRITLRVKVTGP